MVSQDLIKKTQERKRSIHKRFLENLSTGLLSRLFDELRIENYKIKEIFIEPRGNPPREIISPDLIIAYINPSWNLLMIEAKSSNSNWALNKLNQKLFYLRSFVENSEGVESLYEILEGRFPIEILQSCGIRGVAVYRTQKGKFKIYRTEKLR